MSDLNDQMAASELASLAAFARAVLARAVSNEPSIQMLSVRAEAVGGEVEIEGWFHHVNGTKEAGFGL